MDKTALQICIDKLVEVSKVGVTSSFGTGADNAWYGGVSEAGKVSAHRFPCHAYMNGMLQLGNKRPVVVYSRFVHPAKSHKLEETTREFFDWIFGAHSPWGTVLSGMSEENPSTELDFAFENGFVFDNLDTVPANYLHNFLVASRMPKEWPSLIRHWGELVHRGIDPAAAMFLAGVFQPQKKTTKDGLENTGTWYMSPVNIYDWPLDHATCGEDYLRNFMHGHVDASVLNAPWAKADRYTPVNRIWGNNEMTMFAQKTYLHELFERYKDSSSITEDEAKKMKSTIGDFSWIKNWFLTLEDVYRISDLENTRLTKAA